MESKLPARLDRATLDRVLQRATELQSATREIGEGLTESEVLELGREVGISEQHLRQALLEQRTQGHAEEPSGTLDAWLGRADVSADRVVQGTEESIAKAVAERLEHREHFVIQRATLGRVTFEPMDSLAGAMRRVGAMFDPSRAKPYLAKAEFISAGITPLEAGFCHVSLAATLRKTRRGYLAGGTTIGALGPTAGAVLVVAGAVPLFALAPIALFGVAGVSIARSFRPVSERARLGLERLLDDLEKHPAVPESDPLRKGKPQVLARDLGQAVRRITREVKRAWEE